MLYVSHRLEEVFEIADRVTVMRNGREVLTRATRRPDHARGRRGDGRHEAGPSSTRPRRRSGRRRGDRSRRSSSRGSPSAAGSSTSRSPPVPARSSASPGSTARASRLLLGALFGNRRASAGTVRYPDGGRRRSARRGGRRGVQPRAGRPPTQGLMLDRSVATQHRPRRRSARCGRATRGCPGGPRTASPRGRSAALGIKTAGTVGTRRQRCRAATSRRSCSPSGSRSRPAVVLLDDPTRGVDVGAKHEIYALVRPARRRRQDRPAALDRAARARRARRPHPRVLPRPARHRVPRRRRRRPGRAAGDQHRHPVHRHRSPPTTRRPAHDPYERSRCA